MTHKQKGIFKDETKNLPLQLYSLLLMSYLVVLLLYLLGPVKAAPVQHFVNVLCAVFVGPWYGLAQALISSLIRIIFGTGSAFAFLVV